MNLNNVMNDLKTLGDTAVPFKDIVLSSSFVEGAKVAVPNLVQWAIDKQKPFAQLTPKEKASFVGRKIINVFSGRFNYAVLLIKSTMDFVVSLIKGIAATVLYPTKLCSSPREHFRHTGIALFTMLDSVAGIIEPKLGDLGYAGFTVLVLGFHGSKLSGQAQVTFNNIKNQFVNLLPNNNGQALNNAAPAS